MTCSFHRHGRARHEKCCRRRQKRNLLPASCSNATCRGSRRWSSGWTVRMTRFIRTTEERHHRASIGIIGSVWKPPATFTSTNISGGTRCGTRPITTPMKPVPNEDGERVGPQGTPVEWVEEEAIFFGYPPIRKRAARLISSPSRLCAPEGAAQRGHKLCAWRSGDLSISRTTFDWGIKVPRQSQARDVCVGRRAYELHHSSRLSGDVDSRSF
jgi:methionyl-tRNA synthetase